MTTRNVSPGAALLRASRMFSMPAPIPAAPGDFASATKHHSPTATIPHPTYLSVTTPSSSRINGDWGFKRPLPLKTTTNTTIPLVRVRQVDSTEHVTDFQSASDHTLTLEKFKELHMPITLPPPESHHATFHFTHTDTRSVFEEERDVTAIPEGMEEEMQNKRWRFKGPWLAGLTDGEFERYLEKQVRAKRGEFRAFLRKRLATEMTNDRVRKASEDASEVEPESVSAEEVTDRQLAAYIKRLRSDSVELYQLVSLFLDLAPLSPPVRPSELHPGKIYEMYAKNPYSPIGPPRTHPSAGISYLRTRNFQENHPLYGPQLKHTPVEGRVVMPRHPASGNPNPVVGVGGFIVKASQNSSFNTFKPSNRQGDRSLVEYDLETSGGTKKFVDVKDAHIDTTGRVIMRIADPDWESKLVQEEMLGRANIQDEDLKRRSIKPPHFYRVSRDDIRSGGSQQWSDSKAYGLLKSDFARQL